MAENLIEAAAPAAASADKIDRHASHRASLHVLLLCLKRKPFRDSADAASVGKCLRAPLPSANYRHLFLGEFARFATFPLPLPLSPPPLHPPPWLPSPRPLLRLHRRYSLPFATSPSPSPSPSPFPFPPSASSPARSAPSPSQPDPAALAWSLPPPQLGASRQRLAGTP